MAQSKDQALSNQIDQKISQEKIKKLSSKKFNLHQIKIKSLEEDEMNILLNLELMELMRIFRMS